MSRANFTTRLTTLLMAVGLFLLNVYICRDLFHIEYLRHMGSIEGAFIGMSRYIMAHWPDLKWFPLWLDGIPYPTTYPPLLHLVVAFVAHIRGVSAALAYHQVTALAYCLGPVALFALALRLSESRWTAFAAGLMYSCLTFSAWLIPAIRVDMGGAFYPRRLQAMVLYGEGPHVSSMTLIIFAMLFLDLALERAKPRALYFALAAGAFAATVADNWLGAFATVLFVVPYGFARFESLKWKGLGWIAGIAATAYFLAMPLVPPSTISTMVNNAKTTGGDYAHAYQAALPQGLAILTALILIKLAVRKLNAPLQFAIFLSLVMTLVTLADAFWNLAIVPMGIRYHLEMEMAFCLLAAFVAQAMLRDRPKWVGVAAMTILVVALMYPIRAHRRYARHDLLRPIDITNTIEWKMSQWFDRNSNGERVFAPGSVGMWMTVFSDTPELWGFGQGATDYTARVAEYEIYTGALAGPRDAEFSILWMKAFGVHAVGVNGPASTATYRFVDTKKFEGVLNPVWREGDDVIFLVGKHASLARVVPRAALANREPLNGIDVEPLLPYVAALDDPAMPDATFHWTTMHSAKIAANLQSDQVISIQSAWAKGWHASVNGREIPVQRDGIGLMYVEPAITGRCDVDMVYDGGMEMRVANIVSPLTAVVLLILTVAEFLSRVILKKS
jgi:hypothetical protein